MVSSTKYGTLWDCPTRRDVGDHGSVVTSFRPTVATVGGLDRERAERDLGFTSGLAGANRKQPGHRVVLSYPVDSLTKLKLR